EAFEEPSLLSRVLMVVAALAAILLAVWIFAPAISDVFAPRISSSNPITEPQAVSTPMTAATSADIRVINLEATATTSSTAHEVAAIEAATAALRAASAPSDTTKSATQSDAQPRAAAIEGTMPWQPLSSTVPTSAPTDDAALISRTPLPRRRPHLTALGT